MNGERGIVGLNNGVGDLRGRENREGEHHSVWVLLSDLGNEKGPHPRARATAQGVADLEALHAVTVLGLLADDVEDGVDELGALCVVALGPVVAGAGLAEDEVVRAEDGAVGAGSDAVHGAGLEIHEDGAGDEAAAASLVVVNVDALQLEVVVPLVPPRRIDPVLCAHHLPEFGPDLVPALASLDVEDLPHFLSVWATGYVWSLEFGSGGEPLSHSEGFSYLFSFIGDRSRRINGVELGSKSRPND